MHFKPLIIFSSSVLWTSLTFVKSPVYNLLSYVKILFYNSRGDSLEMSLMENSVLSVVLFVLVDGFDVEDFSS